jgi:hypothetical protein
MKAKEKPQQGTTITFDASKSYDHNGDKLTFKWWIQPEAGTYDGNVDILNNNTSKAVVIIPEDSAGKTIHLICEITDNGVPNLTSYRRVIFEPAK